MPGADNTANDASSLDFLATTPPFQAGTWRVEPARLLLRQAGSEHRLEPRVMALLVVLARSAGGVVTRKDLLDLVWADAVVGGDALTGAVSKLRRALDPPIKEAAEEAAGVSAIDTIPKLGYRLQLPVTWQAGAEASVNTPVPEHSPGGQPRRRLHTATILAAAVLVGLVGLGAWFFGSRPATGAPSRSAPPEIRPVTSFPGIEVQPAVAPGGADRIAFAWQGAGQDNWDVYVIVRGTSTPMRLTDDPGIDREPAWSPDGRHLAYLHFDDEGLCSIYRVSALGGPPRRVAACGGRAESLSWAPDGKRLLYAVRPGAGEPFRIVSLSLSEGTRLELTSPPPGSLGDLRARYSPDGKTLAFIRSPIHGVEDIFLHPPGQPEPERLTADNLKIHGMDWARDGRTLVFSSNRAGLFSLWRIARSGGEPTWIGITGGDVDAPSIGAAGFIAYEQWRDETNIYRLDPRTGDKAEVVRSTHWDFDPAVSPGSQRLAFVSDRSGSSEIWVSDAGRLRKMTDFGGPYVTAPSWDPTGRRIAFEARVNGNGDVYLLDGNELEPRRVTLAAARDAVPSWSRNGERLYFASRRSGSWQIHTISPDGGDPRQLTTAGGFLAQETGDGQWVLFSKHDQPGLFRMPVGGGAERQVIADLNPVDRGQWVATHEAIYVVRHSPDGPTVLVGYDLDGSNRRDVGSLDRVAFNSRLAAGEDGQILFSRVDRWESDIHLASL